MRRMTFRPVSTSTSTGAFGTWLISAMIAAQSVLLQGFLHLREDARVAGDIESAAGALEVVRAGVEGDAHERVFVGGRRVDAEDALAFEEIADAAGAAHFAAAALEDLADLAGGAVAVVGQDFHQDGHAAGAITFVRDLLEDQPFHLAGAAFDGALDVVLGHADAARALSMA